MGLNLWGLKNNRQVTSESNWKKPILWNRQAELNGISMRIFCASLCDIFEDHPTADLTRPKLFELIKNTPNLDWQILTKRTDRILQNLPKDWNDGYPNVWLGVSIENSINAKRADFLRKIPSIIRFVSYEPALGSLDNLDLSGIHWVIYGGESGNGFRPENKEWARTMLKKCRNSKIAFFHKQSAGYRTEMGIELDGKIVREYPMPKRSLKKELKFSFA